MAQVNDHADAVHFLHNDLHSRGAVCNRLREGTSAAQCTAHTNERTRPKSDRPPNTLAPTLESAHGVLQVCVSVMYRAPRRCIMRSAPRDESME